MIFLFRHRIRKCHAFLIDGVNTIRSKHCFQGVKDYQITPKRRVLNSKHLLSKFLCNRNSSWMGISGPEVSDEVVGQDINKASSQLKTWLRLKNSLPRHSRGCGLTSTPPGLRTEPSALHHVGFSTRPLPQYGGWLLPAWVIREPGEVVCFS